MSDGEGGDGRMNRLRRIFVETLSWIEICSPPVLMLFFFIVVFMGMVRIITVLLNP